MHNTQKRLTYRGREVDGLLGVSRSARYTWQDPNSPQFDPTWPLPIRLSARSVGYPVAEVEAWLAARPRTRHTEQQEDKSARVELAAICGQSFKDTALKSNKKTRQK